MKTYIFQEPVTPNTAKFIEYRISDTGCHICVSHPLNRASGYSLVRRNKQRWLTHRYVYTLTKGEIPKGLQIRHTCDNPLCINPDHLLVGTAKENAADCKERGRLGARGRRK